jgi:glycosyltransferase involved in cell wall biosynthesis
MHQIRVLHVINQLSARAGAEVSLREMIVGSLGAGVRHAVVVLSPDVVAQREFGVLGVEVFSPHHDGGRTSQLLHTLRGVRAFGPDLIHTSLFEADLIGRIAGRMLDVPVLTSFVNAAYGTEAARAESVPDWKLAAVRTIDGFLARNATSAFHAISDATAEHAVEHLGVSRRHIRVVPRGRRVSSLGTRSGARRARVRADLGWGDEPVILNVARQEPQKGHRSLLSAVASVRATFPAVRLVLVGRQGRSSDEIRSLITRLGLEGTVQDLGSRGDVPDLLSAADAFAFSSLYEGLGGAVVEAAGVGVPVAAFAIPAVEEVLGPEHPWLVRPGDVAGFASAIVEILNGGGHVDRVAARQRARFLERYELERCVEDMMELYRDVARAAGAVDHRWRLRPEKLSVGA